MTEDTKSPEADGQDVEESADQNIVTVEEAGTLKKRVDVAIPRNRIEAKQDEMFGELRATAQIPGFRIGRAPRKLIEKRFGKEITEDIRNALIGESVGDALEQAELKTLGEPDIDLDEITLPEEGDMHFSFEVEIQPEFELPGLEHIPVKQQAPDINDQRVDEQISNILEGQARYEKTQEPAEDGDRITAAATITGDGVEHENPRIQARVAPSVIEGLPIPDLAKTLIGVKAGDRVSVTVTCPDTHPREEWRSKELTIDLEIHEVTRRIVPELNEEWATAAGFDSVNECRDWIAGRLKVQAETETQRDMRNQVCEYLLDNTDFELPPEFAQRHATEALQRRQLELMQSGIPREKIEENLAELQASVEEQAQKRLKLSFIIQNIADEKEIEVPPAKINAAIAHMASQYGRRPERVKQELVNNGAINQVAVAVLEEEVLDALLKDADVEVVEPEPTDKEKSPEKEEEKKQSAAKKTKKKTAKKKTKKKTTKKKTGDKKKTKKKTAKKKTTKKSAKKKTTKKKTNAKKKTNKKKKK